MVSRRRRRLAERFLKPILTGDKSLPAVALCHQHAVRRISRFSNHLRLRAVFPASGDDNKSSYLAALYFSCLDGFFICCDISMFDIITSAGYALTIGRPAPIRVQSRARPRLIDIEQTLIK